MDDYKVVMTKSTVPVGTSDKVKATVGATLIARGVQVDFDVVRTGIPEGGAAIADFRSRTASSSAPTTLARRNC
jgi:UDPglucose 6-dehydrogenase